MSSRGKPTLETSMITLKNKVLESQIEFLCEELGDPGRYFPQLRSKGILSVSDCQGIRSKGTLKEKIEELVALVKGKQSSKGEHSFDVLVDALKKQRVQAHIARGLQKALAKAKEEADIPGGAETKWVEKVARKPSFQDAQLVSGEIAKKEEHDVHPEHGLLPPPPPPPPSSVQSMGTTSYNCSVEHQELNDPRYGRLPTCAKTASDVMVFTTPQSVMWRNTSGLESSSESELGGQSLMSAMPTSIHSDTVLPSLSTTASSMSDSSGIAEDESVIVAKLEAKVQDLKSQLEEATIKIDEKNDLIDKLKAKLSEYERNNSKKEEEGKLSKESNSSSGNEVDHPRALKLGSSQQHHHSRAHAQYHSRTVPSISPSSSGGSLHRERRGQHSGGSGESVVYNNFINYSRNSTSNASVSTV